MANGTPIRLIQRNGGIFELYVTTLTMNVDRKFNPKPLPYSGSHRVASDANLSRATIQLEGVVTDDDVAYQSSVTKALAQVDFSWTKSALSSRVMTTSDYESLVRKGSTHYDTTTVADAPYLKIDDNNSIYMISHPTDASGVGPGGEDWVNVYNSSASPPTVASIANAFKTIIDSYSGYEAFLTTSPYTSQPTTLLNIRRLTNGNADKYPKWKQTGYNSSDPDIVRKFVGYNENSDTSSFSAGDKVQRLWGVLNNSQDGGSGNNRGGGDYIIGIQIPFDSMVNAASGEKYSAVNHFMTTGSTTLRNVERKDVGNALAAGTVFDDSKNSYTGIKGGVDSATFVRLGGEPLYQFTIIFLPADVIL